VVHGDWSASAVGLSINSASAVREPLNKSRAMARASDWDGPQGANRSHSLGYGEDLQRRGLPNPRMRDS
jgi:hypothetical protein